MRRGARAVSALSFALACTDESTQPVPDPIDNDEVALPRGEDADPAEGSFELALEAAPVSVTYGDSPATPAWGYNGGVPGPLVEVAQGDILRVHFKNSLPDETTIHWHGVRVPNEMDGVPTMMSPVPAGGSFEYAFTLKDAGLFWYHPHVASELQVQRGLYGAIVVRGADEPASDRELVLILDDIRLLPDGAIDEYPDDNGVTNGREGKTILVNGKVAPTLHAQPGETLRLRLVNAANGRFFNLKIGDQKLRVIGTDGGLIPKPYDVDTLVMAPGERYDVMTTLGGAVGDSLPISTEPYDRGHATAENPALPVGTLSLEGSPVKGKPLPTEGPAATLLPDAAPSEPIVLNEAFINGEQKFTINDQVFPDVPPISVPLGEVRLLAIENKTEQEHPFHLHGFFFQVVARNGNPVAAEDRFDKDTVIVPQMSTLTLAARFDAPGGWMYHCHILEHADRGMMGMVEVE